jgi:UDP-glucuronate 4-epimerase
MSDAAAPAHPPGSEAHAMMREALAGQQLLVTGAAGFIGMHVARALLDQGALVTGVDSFDAYYDVALKHARVNELRAFAGFAFEEIDLAEAAAASALFARRFGAVVHLAAQPGVRYSLVNPAAYVRNNLVAFAHVLEGCRLGSVRHLVYASSSSVYGANHVLPFSEDQPVDHPVSLYAATKKANELMAHSYSHLYRLPTTGLRFFTVYGPWGRPDMALFTFTRNILDGKPIDVFNNGHHKRDFTYVDDIAEGVVRASERIAQPDPNWNSKSPDPSSSSAPFRVYNIGNNEPVQLMRYIEVIEECLGRTAQKNFLPMQPGDVPETFADIDDLVRDVGYRPATPIETGVRHFVDWFCQYYGYKK